MAKGNYSSAQPDHWLRLKGSQPAIGSETKPPLQSALPPAPFVSWQCSEVVIHRVLSTRKLAVNSLYRCYHTHSVGCSLGVTPKHTPCTHRLWANSEKRLHSIYARCEPQLHVYISSLYGWQPSMCSCKVGWQSFSCSPCSYMNGRLVQAIAQSDWQSIMPLHLHGS